MSQVVLDAIQSEREYQKRRWGKRQSDGSFVEAPHSPDEFLLYMQAYVTKAIDAASTSDGCATMLAMMRKVVTLGIACFEQHGCPFRDLSKIINGRDGLPA